MKRSPGGSPVRVGARVARALSRGEPVVALESSVFAQGLPEPANRDACARMIAAIEEQRAVPAITGVVGGRPTAGIEKAALARFLRRVGVEKVSARDLAGAGLRGADGATTVAGAMVIARLAGIDVFATGGIGGVHRGGTHDESADLLELSRLPMIVVCSGAKSILDVRATAERLETLGVTVVGYRTDTIPAFFSDSTDLPVTVRVESPAEVAGLFERHLALGRPGALLVVQPPPGDVAISGKVMEAAVSRALRQAAKAGVSGPAITPFLLHAVEGATGGRSLLANVALLEQNAALAARIAAARRGTE